MRRGWLSALRLRAEGGSQTRRCERPDAWDLFEGRERTFGASGVYERLSSIGPETL